MMGSEHRPGSEPGLSSGQGHRRTGPTTPTNLRTRLPRKGHKRLHNALELNGVVRRGEILPWERVVAHRPVVHPEEREARSKQWPRSR
jgi:hypothetical protein